MTTLSPDFCVTGSGSVFLLIPLTDAANEWVEANLPEDAQRLGRGIAVEHRYILDIVDGAQADGLTFTR